jgi:DNA-directed RNA polymerase subunit RPC12/RpoP
MALPRDESADGAPSNAPRLVPRTHAALEAGYRDAAVLPRRYVCHACRAPNRALPAGGAVRCAECGAERVLPERSATARRARPLTPEEDAARVSNLWIQSPQPSPAPPALSAVLEGGAILAPGKEPEALELWFALRARAPGDPAAAEALFTLTRHLYTSSFLDDDEELRHALVDDALDACSLERHRNVLTAMRVRQAAGRGDLATARAYFGWLDLAPEDRESDTHARLAAAFLAIAERRWDDALRALGRTRDELPLTDEFADLAVVLRAHALEASGDLDAARRALGELRFPSLVARARALSPALDLCRVTGDAHVSAARAARAAALARRARRLAWGGVSIVAVAAFLLVAALASGDDREATGAIAAGLGVAVLGAAVAGASLVDAARTRRAYLHGPARQARVLAARPVHGTRNTSGAALYEFDLDVAGPSGPYRTVLRMPSTPVVAPSFVGRTVRVRAHPEKPRLVVYEDDPWS